MNVTYLFHVNNGEILHCKSCSNFIPKNVTTSYFLVHFYKYFYNLFCTYKISSLGKQCQLVECYQILMS